MYIKEGRPLAISAVKPALGPGIVSTFIFWLRASTTNSYPGSLISGNPASETKAIFKPEMSCSIKYSVCCSCYVHGTILKAFQSRNGYITFVSL